MKLVLRSWIQNNLKGNNIILLLILIAILFYGLNRSLNRENNGVFVEGISDGIHKGAKGSLSLRYHFVVDNVEYSGSVPSEFCKQCKNLCCDSGSIVVVRYEYNNPENSDLVVLNPNK
jgi:hypothetical protein